MALQGSLGFEGFGTIFTAKKSFFSMSARFMQFESFFYFEGLLADIAKKLFVICMNQLCVSTSVGALGKLLGAHFALERFFSSVNSCMQYDAPLRAKSLRTIVALIRPIIKMNLFMKINTALSD